MHLVEMAFFTDDVARMTAFYGRLLHRQPVAQSDSMAIFLIDGVKLFIHQTYEPAAGDLPPENHVALAVADVDHACALLGEQGLVLEVPPQDYYWGRSAYLRDPDGHLIEITQAAGEKSQEKQA